MELIKKEEVATTIDIENDDDSITVLASLSEKALAATWEHLIKNNLEKKWSSVEWKAKLLQEEYPDECILTTIQSSSTTTRRGKRKRAYPRKGVIKIDGDAHASKQKIGVHQLAAWKSTGRSSKTGEQASHWKCDNEECVNPLHIIWEIASHNSTRYCCKIFKTRKGYKCPHNPTCSDCSPCPSEDEN